MKLALIIIKFALLIITLCFVAYSVWGWKLKGSSFSQVTYCKVLAAMLFTLNIPRLVLEVLLGKEYVVTIIFLVLWALILVFSMIISRLLLKYSRWKKYDI